MKTVSCILSLTALVVIAASAYAFGPAAKTADALKLPGMVANPANSLCQTIPAGRSKSVSINTASTMYVGWTATDSNGNPVVVKRSFNGNTAALSKSSEGEVGVNSATTSMVFTRYSGASNINLCTDAQ